MSKTILRAEELDKLQLISAEVKRVTELETLCWLVIDWVEDMTDLPDCVVYVRRGNILTQVAALGCKRDEQKKLVNRVGLPLGVGITGSAAEQKQSLYIPDVAQDSRYVFDEFNGRSEFCCIFEYRGEVVGAIDIEHPEVDGISELNRQIIQSIADLTAPHIAALLDNSSANRPDLSEVIADLAHQPPTYNLQTAFANITERAAKTLHVSRANIWLFNDENTALTCADHFDLAADEHTSGASLERSAYPAYFEAIGSERVVIAHDAARDPRTCELDDAYLSIFNIKSLLDAPIWQDGKLVGIVCLEQQESERNWTQEEASFVGTLADLATIALISDRRTQAENVLIQSQKMLSLGRMAGGIAHDFNNLLTVISGAVETLQIKLDLDDGAMRLTNLIMEASVRASRLTRNLLAFGGKQPLELRSISASELCANIKSLVSDIIRKDIDLKFVKPETEIWTSGDISQLEQVLLNLILNAVDAQPRGGQIEIQFIDNDPNAFEVTVRDFGSGIDDEVIKQIFDPFFTTKGEDGTGLGLSVCQGIIRQHKGTLECESQLGRGSLFRIRLPRTGERPLPEAVTETVTFDPDQQPITQVLLVEDETGVRTVVTQMLKALGYVAVVADNAKHALELLKHKDIDLLLSDVVMPDIRGPEVFQQAVAQQPKLRALFVSGYTDDVLKEIPIHDERVAYLPKPFTLAELRQALLEITANP